LENFLLVPEVLKRAVDRRVEERNRRTGGDICFAEDIGKLLISLTEPMRHRIQARYLARRRNFEQSRRSGRDDSTIEEQLLAEFDGDWTDDQIRMLIVPGKETLSTLNSYLQKKYSISLSLTLIVESFHREEVPEEMVQLLHGIDGFRQMDVDEIIEKQQ
jgi:hypothetical protein